MASSAWHLPKNYELVYEIVREQGAAGAHVRIGDLYTRARERQPGIGFATVYRAVIRLRDLHLLEEVHVPGVGGAFYEPSGKKHGHFVCELCGAVSDVALVISPRALQIAAQRLEADVSDADVTLRGRCKDCRQPA